MPGFADDIGKLTPHLRRLARALVPGHGAQAADDLVQETIVLAGRSDLPKRGPVLAIWCFASLVRLNRLRARTSRPTVAAAEPLPFLPKDVIRLDGLSLDHREVLLLTVLAGFSYAQVADILGIDLALVIDRLTEARDALARIDGDDLGRGGRDRVDGRRSAAGPTHLRLVK